VVVAPVPAPVAQQVPVPAPVMAAEPVALQPAPVQPEIARPRTVRPAEAEYEFPPISLLQEPQGERGQAMQPDALQQSAGLLESILEDFGIRGEIIDVRPGPVVTLYEFEPAPGVKSSRVIGLADDIARSMSALSARVAVVPGRNVIGIELPNATRETVYFRELIECEDYWETKHRLALCLGKTIGGEPVIAELAKMPHLLVAGTTGSGKSVAINTMILSLLYRLRPEECRLIMIDPKMLELSVYDGIPHLLTPVVTDPKKAVLALKWAVREMEDRYKKMSRLAVRNIDGYNQRAASAREKGEVISVSVQAGFDRQTGEILYEEQEMDLSPMPYIVVIVDEMADLMMVAGKDIEGAIQRLAQMARAAGIHLIMATQRPSVDVITGTIKANFPTRISFQVTSKIDSRTILGEQGAEHLLGQGDMLHMAGGGRISRVHGPFVSDAEVELVVRHLKTQGRPDYLGTVTEDEDAEEDEDVSSQEAVFDKSAMGGDDSDELYDKAVKVVMKDRKCSTSYIQRRLSVGYNRAASLVERMEQEGLVGPANHVGKREIIAGGRSAAAEDFGD
ncbi:DNA translocase FtsK, partial [Neorhizobium sp. SHOUNA12B]